MGVDYQFGKIYLIGNTINTDVYVGSSAQIFLFRRWSVHRAYGNDPTQTLPLYVAMRLHGRDNFFITLHHAFPCNTKLELEAEEYKTLDAIKASGIHTYNLRTTGNKQALVTKQTIAATKKAQNLVGKLSGTFNYGCISFQKGLWIFSHEVNLATTKKCFSVKRLGYWQAKLFAEAERKRVYPEWQTDEEITLNEFGAMDLC